jgi:hypothetical protein
MVVRSFHVTVRFSEEERRKLREQAEASGLTVSGEIRRRVLGRRSASQADLSVLTELRRLGAFLKRVHLETRASYSERMADAIRAVGSCVRELEQSHNEKMRAKMPEESHAKST